MHRPGPTGPATHDGDFLTCPKCSGPQPGTEWTEPGQGASTIELLKTIISWEMDGGDDIPLSVRYDSDESESNLRKLGLSNKTRTNLRLTGAPLTPEDLRRIATCK